VSSLLNSQPRPQPLVTAYGAPVGQHSLIGRRIVAGALVLAVTALLPAPVSFVLGVLALGLAAYLLR
jgi:hypothetical protein